MFRYRKIYLVFTLVVMNALNAMAQVSDSSLVDFDTPTDTASFYKQLYQYSKNRKAVFWIYRAVFNPPKAIISKKPSKKKNKPVDLKKYNGKIVRNIEVLSLEPFGTNINDTTRHPRSFVQKALNTAHIESRRQTILNYILVKKGRKLGLLEMKESERLLRSTGFIRDVKIEPHAVKGSRDSVDLFILTQDYWSIRPDISATTSKVRYRIKETNFLGFGHTFDNRFTDRLNESSPLIIDGSYTIPSIGTSYISPGIYYGTDPNNNQKGILVNRPFYSPLTKFAWGVEFFSRAYSDSITLPSDTTLKFKYRLFSSDFWMGYSFPIKNGETDEERSTRIIAATRFSRNRYPLVTPDLEELTQFYTRSDLYLASISFSSRKYVTDKYIFKFGDSEDVPDGRKLTFTSGFEDRKIGRRYYMGIDAASGTYFDNFGYFYTGIGYGTFLNRNTKYIGILRTDLLYFSELKKIGSWRLRQFGAVNFVYGMNRASNEYLHLNSQGGIPGYKDHLPQGTSRLTLTLQSVFYSPFEFLGFRFAPVFIGGIGMVGNYNSSVLKSRVYQTYGFGLLVKNELLVLNTFQVIIAIYPVLPEGGSLTRFDPVRLNEERFQDFEITKPHIEPFQ